MLCVSSQQSQSEIGSRKIIRNDRNIGETEISPGTSPLFQARQESSKGHKSLNRKSLRPCIPPGAFNDLVNEYESLISTPRTLDLTRYQDLPLITLTNIVSSSQLLAVLRTKGVKYCDNPPNFAFVRVPVKADGSCLFHCIDAFMVSTSLIRVIFSLEKLLEGFIFS